jgi:hypothetical protein
VKVEEPLVQYPVVVPPAGVSRDHTPGRVYAPRNVVSPRGILSRIRVVARPVPVRDHEDTFYAREGEFDGSPPADRVGARHVLHFTVPVGREPPLEEVGMPGRIWGTDSGEFEPFLRSQRLEEAGSFLRAVALFSGHPMGGLTLEGPGHQSDLDSVAASPRSYRRPFHSILRSPRSQLRTTIQTAIAAPAGKRSP